MPVRCHGYGLIIDGTCLKDFWGGTPENLDERPPGEDRGVVALVKRKNPASLRWQKIDIEDEGRTHGGEFAIDGLWSALLVRES
jgi:hypothetical protein